MRLYDAYKNGKINRTELLAYLDLGYGLYDQVFPTSDRSGQIVNTGTITNTGNITLKSIPTD